MPRAADKAQSRYLSDEKIRCRNRIWDLFSKSVPVVSEAKVAFLPGMLDDEVRIAMALGFKEENLYAIESDPAVIIRSKAAWRYKYPRINYFGTAASKAMRKIAASGAKLAAANLDFTTCFSEAMIRELDGIAETNALARGAVIAITLLRGREKSDAFAALAALPQAYGTRFRDSRFAVAANRLVPLANVRVLDEIFYKATASPMGCVVFQDVNAPYVSTCIVCGEVVAKPYLVKTCGDPVCLARIGRVRKRACSLARRTLGLWGCGPNVRYQGAATYELLADYYAAKMRRLYT